MAKFLQRLRKSRKCGRRPSSPPGGRAGTGGERHHRVTGRGIAVDGDAVEAFIDRPFQRVCNTGASAAASVNTNANMVAISG